MKRTAKLFTLIFLAGGQLAVNAGPDVMTKTFPIKAGGKLVMNVDRGSVHITTSASDKVVVRVTRELKNASAAETKRVLEQHQIEFASSENELKIEASSPKRWLGTSNPFSRLQVDYTVGIPDKFDIDLRTAGGHI